MKKGLFYLGWAALTVITVLIACEKEQLTNQSNTQFDGFSLVEGRLAFESETAFKQTLDKLYSTQNQLDDWEKHLPEYQSMRTYFETMADKTAEEAKAIINNPEPYRYTFTFLTEANGDQSMERNLYNDVLATLVNHEGYLQIGDQVHRFTYSHYYSTNSENIDLLKTGKLKDPKVTATAIQREVLQEQSELKGGILTGRCITVSGNKRVKGTVVREATFDNDCNITTKHQKRVGGVWWANRASVSVRYSGNFVKSFSSCSPAPKLYAFANSPTKNQSSITLTVRGNLAGWNGCNGQVNPFHDNQYSSTHVGGGKTCTIICPAGTICTFD